MQKNVHFVSDINPLQRVISSSERYTEPFYIGTIKANFPPGSGRLLKVRVWVGADVPPGAENLIQLHGNVDYLVGDGNTREVIVNRWFGRGNKIHAEGESISTNLRTLDVDVEVAI